MSLGRRPNKQRAQALGLSIKAAANKASDPERIMAIWNDLRWKMKSAAGNYEDISKMVLDSIERAKVEIVTPALRDPVVLKLEQMRGRLSEFTVGEEMSELVFCSNCGQEIPPGVFRKDVSKEIVAFLCAKCSAIPGLE